MQKSMLALLLVTALATPVAAQNNPGTDMIAITAGQAAQVNIANTRSPSSSAPCRVVIEFHDRDGNAIGGLPSGGVALAPGQVASAAIEHPALRPGERFLVRVYVRKLESKAALGECGGVRASAEIFDTDTGKTTIFWKLADG